MLGCAVAAVAAAGPAAAQERTFNVPAQDAVTGIPEFARQAGLQVLAAESAVRGRRTQAVVGQFSTDEALAMLLEGTGLRIASRTARTITLAPQSGRAPGGAAQEQVSELVVTGSRLKGQPPGPTPVNTYDEDSISTSGQVKLEGFLNSLPEVSISAAGNGFTRYGGTSSVRLRGLPDGSTAVLLDGRRTAVSGYNVSAVFDLGSVPLSMVERIDVVPIGSSAVYGSDAIGGVVNVILKRRFDGAEAKASYSAANQHEERDLSLAFGKTWDRGGLSLAASYHDNDGLYGYDRAITRNSDFTRFADKGGADRRLPYCAPGTVTAASGSLNGLGSPSAAIPTSGADEVANYRAGEQNLCSLYAGYAFVTPSKRANVLISGEYEIGGVTVYGSLLGAYVRNSSLSSAGRSVSNLLVPASNPFNPFGQDVRVTTAVPIPSGQILESQTFRPLVGLRGSLGETWDWDVTAWATLVHDDISDYADGGVTAVLPALLARTDPATAFNPFDPASNSDALLSAASPLVDPSSHGEQENLTAVLRGDAFSLPAGPVSLAVGGELRRESYNGRNYAGFDPVYSDGSREVWAVFSEAAVPLVGAHGAPFRLVASLAGRYDHYSDFGGKFTPALGLQAYLPDGLRAGATYSTSFKAPGLTWMNFPIHTYSNSAGLVDPQRHESYPMTLFIGGNPDLQPETGKAKALTLTWDSERFTGLHAGTTYWEIDEDDRIGAIGYQLILDSESLFPGRVIREASTDGTPGRVISVNNTYTNFGSLRVRGVDASLRYDWITAHGTFTPSVALTRTLSYSTQLLPAQPPQDRLSKATRSDAWAPRWKATLALDWRGQKGESARIQGRYVGRYLDYQDSPNTNELGDDWYLDLSAEMPLDLVTDARLAKGAYVRLGATNLLDNLPSYSNFSSGYVGYDPAQADLIGRMVTFTVGARF